MKITIEQTEKFTEIDGATVRVWNGVTDRGIPCTVFVRRIAVKEESDCSVFEHELRETGAPTELINDAATPRVIPLKMIL